jgi:hypothetical protein
VGPIKAKLAEAEKAKVQTMLVIPRATRKSVT